jgi:hypothetical protein
VPFSAMGTSRPHLADKSPGWHRSLRCGVVR